MQFLAFAKTLNPCSMIHTTKGIRRSMCQITSKIATFADVLRDLVVIKTLGFHEEWYSARFRFQWASVIRKQSTSSFQIHFALLLFLLQKFNHQTKYPYKIPNFFSTTACGWHIFSENSGVPKMSVGVIMSSSPKRTSRARLLDGRNGKRPCLLTALRSIMNLSWAPMPWWLRIIMLLKLSCWLAYYKRRQK